MDARTFVQWSIGSTQARATIGVTTRSKCFISHSVARSWPLVGAAATILALAAAAPARAAPEPLFTSSPPAPFTNEAVTFTSNATGVVEPQQWDLDGDGACDDASGPTATRSFPLAGSSWSRLCVTGGPRSWTDPSRVAIRNRVPIASFTFAPQ